ncbi:serine/threonine protein kinase [Streptomyces populi]|uniref:non-specific serine/threonine protein kinase n=1 Tax=Streptomyces populi TaxID=2058924 RepID=A0A2I0SIK3_9ACTN|nr:serine/threonine-protein kinase [Streptomyces populi]PKT69765.1 serine/threonine protein kinase [Streptomyces populi]
MGEVFAGRYELVDPIGHGGVGAVWRAWDHRRRRYVAAKVLQQSDAHALLRFVREQALRIDHPHVLAPASWAADDDKVLFTMDLVAGGSLVHLVNDYGPLPPSFVCTLTDQLLAGLAAVHAEGVVHRDIKPANVLLEATGTGRPRLRLSDFGIAMRLGEPRLTETNYVVGTPGYIAPEQLLGSEPDFPADLFAVGLVALYLLEGSKPDAKALIEYFAEHGTPSAPRGIPEPLWQVVAMLLQPDPYARFRTATGARKALAAAVELLPEPGPDDEMIEVFDQLGPLPEGFGPTGPLGPRAASRGSSRTLSSPGLPDTTAAAPGAGSGSGVLPVLVSAPGPDQESGSEPSGLQEPREPSEVREPRESWEVQESWGSVPEGVPSVPGGRDGDRDLDTGGALPVSRPVGAERDPAENASGQRPSGDGTPTRSGSGEAVPRPGREHVRPPAASDGVQARPAPEAVPPAAPDETPQDPAPGVPPRPSSMSDTGSFHLPPPRPVPDTGPRRQPQTGPPHHPSLHLRPQQDRPDAQTPTPPVSVPLPSPASAPPVLPPFDRTPTPPTAPLPAHASSPHQPSVPPAAMPQHAYASTASYTARSVQDPPGTPALPGRRRRRARPRPGPPAAVAVPMFLLALACFAVGFWALTQI